MSAMTIAISLVASNMAGGAFASLIGQTARLANMFNSLGKAGSGLTPQLAGVGVAAAATGLAFGAMFEVVKTGIDDAAQLQMALTRLQLASQLGSDAFNNLKLAVVDMATHSLYSTTDAAAAFEKLSEMGFTASQTMYGMGAAEDAVTSKSYDAAAALQGVGRQAMAVGEAMQTDAVTGATLLGSALHTFQSEGLSAAQAANILVGTFYNGVPSAEALQQAINNAGAMASAAGIKFQDFNTTLALLAKAGLPAAQAGTSLRYMIQSLIAPTSKQSKALAELGITTVNTNGYLNGLLGTMDRQDKAARKAAQAYDGSVASLQDLFKAAQKAGDVPLDATFNQWAMANGLLNTKLFDSQGQFLGLRNAIDVLDQAMSDKGMSMQQKMDIITQLFNVRSGRAAQILTNIQQFDSAYQAAWDRIGKTDALANAQKVMDTFSGSVQMLKTSISSALAEAFMPLIVGLTPLVQGLNNLVGAFLKLDPQVQGFAGMILLAVTALLGISSVVLGIVFIVTVFGTVIGTVMATAGPIILGIAAGIAFVVTMVIAFKNALDQNQAVMDFFANLLQLIGQWAGALWDQLVQLWGVLQQLAPVWEVLKVVLMAVAVAIGALLLGAVLLVIGIFIALTFVIRIVIQVIILVVGAIISFVVAVVQWFAALPQHVHDALIAVATFFTNIWNGIVSFVQDTLQNIKDAIQNGLNFVLGIVQNVVNTVVGWFKWLYDHNYYFQNLVDAIRNAFTWVRDFIQMIWNKIVSWLTGVWNGIVGTAKTAWHNVTGAVKTGLDNAHKWVVSIGTNIKTWLSDNWDKVKKTAKDAWTNFTGAISGAWGGITGAVGGVVDRILGPIKDLAGKMYEWGKNLMNMLGNGIKDAAGHVWDAAKNVGNGIKSLLGFHSPTKEGPLSDSDQYMPNMMRMFARGITDHLPVLNAALLGVSGLVAGKLSNLNAQITTPGLVATANAGLASGRVGQVTIPVTLDGKQIAQYTLDLATMQMKQSGITRYAR